VKRINRAAIFRVKGQRSPNLKVVGRPCNFQTIWWQCCLYGMPNITKYWKF